MAQQRPRVASPPLPGIDGVASRIIQCTPDAAAVVAFLNALTPAMRSPAMTALLQLLSTPWGAKHWPTAYLCSTFVHLPIKQQRYAEFQECEGTTDDEIHRLVTAMPLFNAACIDGISSSTHWVKATDVLAFGLPYCRFVAAWSTKMTEIDITHAIPALDRRDFLHMLGFCTRLKEVCIPLELDLVTAVTAPERGVSTLDLVRLEGSGDLSPEFLPPLARWLASGRAVDLSVFCRSAPKYRADMRVILAASWMANECATSYMQLDIETFSVNHRHTSHLMKLLPMTTIKTLALRGTIGMSQMSYGNWTLALLPQLPALACLTLYRVVLDGPTECTPVTHTPSMLHTLSLINVEVSGMEFLAEIIAWASRSPCLETLEWIVLNDSDTRPDDMFVQVLKTCIQCRVRRVRLQSHHLRDAGAAVLAKALRDAQALELDLVGNSFRLDGLLALLDAVATCTNVSLKLPRACRGLVHGRFAQWARRDGVVIDVTAEKDIYLHSRVRAPTMTRWTTSQKASYTLSPNQ